jgi:DNA-binding Lrp family transcriptional regulator
MCSSRLTKSDRLFRLCPERSRLLFILDRLEVSILRELTQSQTVQAGRVGVGSSYRKIAKRVGATAGTVRNRISRMYESGVITGTSVFPNPTLLGLKAAACAFDISPSLRKTEVIRKLRLVDGVIAMHDFVGTLAWIVYVYEGEESLARKRALFNEIAAAEGAFSSLPYPPCHIRLTPSDARLILQLTEKGLASYSEIAEELGFSLRTLNRRLSKLVRNGAILSLPKMNYRAITGCIPADLMVFFSRHEDRKIAEAKILKLVQDSLVFAALFDIVGMCSLMLPRVAATSDLAKKVMQIDGVKLARVEIVAEHIDQSWILGEYLQRWMVSRGMGPIPKPGLRSQQLRTKIEELA